MRQLYLFLILTVSVLAVGCAEPDLGPAAPAGKYAAELEQACGGVPGCDVDALRALTVHEMPSKAAVTEVCFGEASGCYLQERAAIVVVKDCRNVARHEFLHAAFTSVGVETIDHPAVFWDTSTAIETPLQAAGLIKSDPLR